MQTTVFRFLLLVSPVFFLTVKHWTNVMVLVLFMGATQYLWTTRKIHASASDASPWLWGVSCMLGAPFAAIAISQYLRGAFYAPNWDAPFRWVLCIPIFMALASGWLHFPQRKSLVQTWLVWVLPITLLWTLFFRVNWPTTSWGPELTTYFVDPLTFGSYNLLFALLVVLGLTFYWSALSWPRRLLSALAIVSGLYLSLTSGTRTGWLNLPVFVCLWTFLLLKPWLGTQKALLSLAVFALALVGISLQNSYVASKFVIAWTEISQYKMHVMNADTSVGLRLSFYRMGLAYFLENPLMGWGDLGWMLRMHQPQFMEYASEFARQGPQHGFHNEIITNAVRSGIWGLLASVGFFIVVFVRALQGLRLGSGGAHRVISVTLLVCISHWFIAGLTTEITNLVFLSSFIGLTVAVLLGEQLYLENKPQLLAA